MSVKKKVASLAIFVLLLLGMLSFAFNIKPAKAEWTGTVYIRADGSIDPPDAPISTIDKVTYRLTGNIISDADGIIVERSNIIIDGNGYTLHGPGKIDPSKVVGRSWSGVGINLTQIDHVTIKRINIEWFEYGVVMKLSSNNDLIENNINDNVFGVDLHGSSFNNVYGNNIINNFLGISIGSWWETDSTYNNIIKNKISGNMFIGLLISWCSNNVISENNITNNGLEPMPWAGIVVEASSGNKFYHNNVIENKYSNIDILHDPKIPVSINIWDDGYPSGGNYWSDYTGVDFKSGPNQDQLGSDGIGDTPYVIDANNRDRYPLMKPWTPTPVMSEQPQLKAPWRGIARITQGNKGPTHKDYGIWDNTYAIDVALPIGSDVLAPADGVVKYVDNDPGGAGGKELAIEHTGPTGKKFVTVYLHLNDILVKEGDSVKQGHVVARSGATGIVTGPHLHFHIWRPKGSEPEWAYDSHTMPIERLVLKQIGVDSEFREYDARKGELDDEKVSGKLFASNNYSPEDVYWLAKAIMSEASIGTREEQIAVGWTVLNRLYSGRYGNSIEYIVTSWYAHNQEPTEVIKTLAKDLLEGQIPDPTSGATHFFSPRGMPKEGEDTTGFDVDGLHQVPLDGQDIKVYFPSWAEPEKGVTITEDTTRYLTAQPIPNKLEWRNLAGVRTWYFMFYRPYTTQISATVGSPVELRVYDTQGRVTGVMNGTIKTDIPRSVYFNNTIMIFFPNDTYRYEVVGTTNGSYSLTVNAVTRMENITFSAIGIPTAAGEIHQYIMDWDTLSRGKEGVTVQVDSDGDGVFEHTFTSDNELNHDEFTLQTATTIDIDPDILNLKSKGKWITAYIEFPEGYNVSDINISSILLNGTIPVDMNAPTAVGDYDNDGIPDLMVKFNRTAVCQLILSKGVMVGNVTLTVSGKLYDGTEFEGSDTIRVRMPGDLNMDGKVDMKDISIICKAFGSLPNHPRWNPIADENEDNKIDIFDIALTCRNFGKTYK